MKGKELRTRIASLLKLKEEDLAPLIKDTDETDIAIDEKLSVLTEDEQKVMKKNSYEDGKKAGVEMEIKEIKEKQGLDFSGKTLEGLLEAKGKKVLADAKIEPDKKVQEMEQKVQTLTNTVSEYEKKIADKDLEVTGAKVRTELYKHIPTPGENGPALGSDDVIQLATANGYEFKLEEGKVRPYKNGQLVTDKLGNALESGTVIKDFMKEKKLIVEAAPPPGGRGKGNEGGSGSYGKLSELKEKFVGDKKSLLGEEFSKAVQEAVKADPNFDMNS